jgi:nucleoside-diphosphate-sugar epimerase
MKIGITGGTGFIGGHVAETAIERGHSVVIMDRNAVGQPIEQVHYGHGIALMLGNVMDRTAMMELAAHVDGIIHLAACLGTQETIQNPYPAAETNIIGGINFLQAVAQYKIAGTYIAVANHFMNNSYSITKTTIERFCHMYNADRGTHVNIVRAVNAYGPRQSVAPPFGSAKVRKIMPSFICRALTGQPIELYGGGEQVSDCVYVTDVALALVKALEISATGRHFPEPVEIGPAQHHSVRDVADLVRDIALGHTTYDIVEHVDLPMRPGEIPGATVTADTATLRHVDMPPLSLMPLDAGIMETVAWYVEHWLPGYEASLP